jgi:ribosomal protein S18 acetylase RimI-like enzyme
MSIRILEASDATAFQALRLRGLAEVPTAFASSFEEEVATPTADVAKRLEPRDDGLILGSFADDVLCGVVGLQRESMRKLRHKAVVWGMYVAPEARRAGHGIQLLQHALRHAWQTLRVRQVKLGVHARNEGAVRLYQRCGFEIFGTELGSLCVDDQLQDEHHMVCRAPKSA